LALNAAGSGSLATPAIALTAGSVNAGGLTLTLTTAQPHLLTASTSVTLAAFTNSTNVNGAQTVISSGLTGTIFALTISAPTFTYIAALPLYSSLTYQTLNTIIYTVSGTPALGSLFQGMYLPALNAYPGTSGIGYLGPPTTASGNPGKVDTISLTYTASQSITAGSATSVTLLVPPQIQITSATASSVSGQTQPYTAAVLGGGSWLQPGWSISGIPGTVGVGYISSVTASTSTPLIPTASTAFSVLYIDAVPTQTSIVSNMVVTALPPTGSIVSTTATSSVQNIIVYNASPTISSALAPTFVNSFLTTNAPSGTGVTAHQITAITYLSAGVAQLTVSFWGAQTGGKSSPTNATAGVSYYAAATAPQVRITPSYPIVNVFLGSSGTMSTGQYALGFIVGNGQPQIPTVNTVYGPVISLNTNQTGAAIDASALSSSYASVAFSFVPSTYYAGVFSAVTGGFTAGGGTVSPITTTGGTGPLPGPGASLLFTPAMTGTTAVAVPVSPYVNSISASTLGFQYQSTGATTTQFPVNSQFVAIPQFLAVAQILSSYPVDNASKTIIQITAGLGATAQPIAVGQQVIGTGFTGPVTVSSVIVSNSSFASGGGTATIELTFISPISAPAPPTGASTAVFFIDPSTASLSPGVTASTPGFTGTYQQLQYEAWCNFVYLDQKERDYFSKTVQDMLITQVQRISIQNATYQEISIAQPVKYIAFLSNNYSTAYQQSQTASYPAATSYYLKTQINGVDVGDSRSMLQWQDVTQYYHTPYGYNNMGYVAPVALIPYCLDTSKLQPTGTLNFSRLDTYRVVAPVGSSLLQLSGGAAYFYAVNYNILRIQNGLGGLLYAN